MYFERCSPNQTAESTMTREKFEKTFHWPKVMWVMGMINVVAMLPQLLNILLTHKVEGLSLTMVSLYLAIQVCFGINGFIKRDIPFFVTMLLSAAMSISVILSTIIIRYS